MPVLHGFDFLLELCRQLCLIGAVNQHLQAFFEKLVRNLLAFQRHHAVFAGNAGKLDHALDHRVLLLDRRQEGFCHHSETAKENRKRRGVHDREEGSAKDDQN